MTPIQNGRANSKIRYIYIRYLKVLGRVGCISIFSDLCFAFLFYSQPAYNIVASSSFKSQDF